MDGLIEGRIVHYVLPAMFQNAGEHRPAIVTRLWQPGGGDQGCCQLQVFLDGTNDRFADGTTGPTQDSGLFWATSVIHSDEKQQGTWHWIERA